MATKTTAKSPTAKTDLKAAATRVKNATKKTVGVTKKASAKSPSAKTDLKAAATRVSNAQGKIVDAAESEINARFSEAQKTAKQVWFAGLGAYGRVFDEVSTRATKVSEELQARYSRLQEERAELVEDLVARGEKVQDDAEARLKEGRANIEDQIETAKNRLVGMTSKVDIPARLQGLSDRLESLSTDLKKSA